MSIEQSTVSADQEVAFIPVASIREHSEALRNVDRSSDQFLDLAKSVEAKGILNPILVRKMNDPATGDEFYSLVDGLQRLTAARDANLTSVPALIKPQTDMDALINQVVTNAMRVETKPVEYTKQLQRLMQMDPLMSLGSLSEMINQSVAWIKQRLGLLNLTTDAADLVDEGLINITNAYALSRLPADEQAAFLDRARELPHVEFVPLTVQRKKDLQKASREGREKEEEVYKPTPKLQKAALIVATLENTAEIESMIEAENCATALEGALAAIRWTLGLDAKNQAIELVKYNERKEAIAKKKQEAELERMRRQDAVNDFKTRRHKYRLELSAAGVAGEELDKRLDEFDKLNMPAKKASDAAEAEAAAAAAAE